MRFPSSDRSLSASSKIIAVLFVIGALIVALGGCTNDDDTAPTGGGTPAQWVRAAECTGEALRVFSEYLNYLTYIPPQIAGIRQVPSSVEYWPADPADSIDPADTGTYRYYLDGDDDDENDYRVEGRFTPSDPEWDGGLWQGDVMYFSHRVYPVLQIHDTAMIGWISLVMLGNSGDRPYRLTLMTGIEYFGDSACDCEITSLSVNSDMSNHDEDSFVMPFGFVEFTADSDAGRFNGLLTISSTSDIGTIWGTIGSDTLEFSIDLQTFDVTF